MRSSLLRSGKQIKRTSAVLSAFAAIALCGTTVARADGLIDFQSIPGGTPVCGMPITTQFQQQFGVTFSLEGGGVPELAEVGGDNGHALGFVYGPNRFPDTPAPGQPVGSFFLTANGLQSGPHNLVLSFATPVASVSGDILDIDHIDGWMIQARDADGNLLGQQSLSATMSHPAGDGIATPWGLSFNIDEVSSVTLSYTGGGATPGLGWDNFSIASAAPGTGRPPTAVPLPSAVWMGGAMLASLFATSAMRRRMRRA